MSENTESQPNLSDALTEAQIIKEIGTWGGDGDNNIVDMIIDDKVKDTALKPEFRQTAKIDIAGQIYEKLEKTSPNLVILLKDRVEATAGLVGFRIRHQGDFSSKTEDEQIESLDREQKNAITDMQQVMYKILEVKNAQNSLAPHEAFSKAISALKKERYFNSNVDSELGYLLTATSAQFKMDSILRNNPPDVNSAINSIDVNRSYERQLIYNKNKNKQEK